MAISEDETTVEAVTHHASNRSSQRRESSSSLHAGGDENLGLSVTEQLSRLRVNNSNNNNNDVDKNTMTRSTTSEEADERFKNLDSVHSKRTCDLSNHANHPAATCGSSGHGGNNVLNNSMEFNDSCASFASFGGGSDDGSKSSLDGSFGELAEQRAAFCKSLDTDPVVVVRPTRHMQHASSFRVPTLHLIEESEGDL